MRWEEPQFGQTSAVGFEGAGGAEAADVEREGALELFDRVREPTEDAVVDFIASTLG
jgi:hypothetical protein